jgi:hypothetical protein
VNPADSFISYTSHASYIEDYFLHALFFTSCKHQHALAFDGEELLINGALFSHLLALTLFDTFLANQGWF